MTAPVVPRLLIDGPPAPIPHRFGLFSAATVLENVDPHTLTGVEYEAVCSTQVDPYPAACEPVPPGMTRRKTPTPTTSVTMASPFAVYAANGDVLARDAATARQQLRQRFLAGEQRAVENIVFTGSMGNTPNLAGEATVLQPSDSTTPVDLLAAEGMLEQWLAEHYGGAGVIHAPQWLAPKVAKEVALFVNGPRAGTVLGSTWVFGAGYPGTKPAAATGADADKGVWLYATSPVTVRRSQVIEPADWATGAFNRWENVGLLAEERIYVADWPCGSAAVKVTTVDRPVVARLKPTPSFDHHTTASITEDP